VKYLVDANVLSETTKPTPNADVVQWLRDHEAELAANPIVLGEIEYGILLLPAGKKRTRLKQWLSQAVQRLRIVELDADTASTWAALLARLSRKGLAMPVKDSLIAASALQYGLTVATRNVADFNNAEVTVVNPFQP
jgi:predicted nucleic acid-binding protein